MNSLVFAIDPGPAESAWATFCSSTQTIMGFKKGKNEELLKLIRDLSAVGANDVPMELVLEQIASYGMAVGAEVFETCVWTGRFMEAWQSGDPNRNPNRIKRGEVKMHLCQSMRAKDGNIRQALIDRFGAPGTKKQPGKTYGISGDCWAALAVAVTFADTKLKNFTQS